MTTEQQILVNSKLFTRGPILQYNPEQIAATSYEAAEAIYEHLEACSVLPPEFKGNYVMQSRLIEGIAKRIVATFNPQ